MQRVTIVFLVCLVTGVLAQEQEIIAEGKVIDGFTRKGVKARIFYKSMPTGSLTGRFNDSTFSFPIFGSSKYQITATAEGYIEGTAIVDPKTMDSNRKVIREITMTKKGENIVLDHLIFEQGKGTISKESFPSLDEVVAMLEDHPSMVIQLEGHTDNAGNAKMNMKLSEDRVENVKKYLVSKGISKSRVNTKAFGGTKPIRNSSDPEARALNRRVEMRILKE